MRTLFATLALLPATAAQTASSVVITEALADNRVGLQDRDGLYGDWVELFNASDEAVSLAGWRLVDDEQRPYVFPTVTIGPRDFLVVFASGKLRHAPERPLHTGFRLSRNGEHLRLLTPDGELASELRFGRLEPDVSTGRPQPAIVEDLVPTMAYGQCFVPEQALPEGWQQPSFPAADWHVGVGGFGFDARAPEQVMAAGAIDVGAFVRGRATTICYRFPFDAPPVAGPFQLTLQLRATSGYVVSLNGVEVARHRVEGEPAFDAVATEFYEERDPRLPRSYDLSAHRGLLRPTGNVLAVHAVLEHMHVERHLVQPRLLRSTATIAPADVVAQFPTPTPGRANGVGVARVPRQPRISPAGALFSEPVRVEVRARGDGVTLRHTLDGSEPTNTSPTCPEELTIDRTCELRVRAFADGVGGRTTSATFTRRGDELRPFASNLQLMVVSTGGRDVPIKAYTNAHVHVVAAADGGEATLAGEPELSCRGAIKIRGSSTLPLAKKGYGVELRDASGDDRARELLGMPAGSDWVLYAPHHWDQAHIRNALCYELARRVGLATPRCRFVELFVCDDGRDLAAHHYRGLYLVVERISIGEGRVDIDRLGPGDVAEPEVTGGYIFKRDRLGPGEVGFQAGGETLQYVAPRERSITDAQRAWLRGFLGRFAQGMRDGAFDDPERGYENFLDVASAIDFHLHQEFTNNPDAFTLSTYFHKPRGGKLRAGPVWDFDRAFRTNDAEYWLGRPGDPYGWTSKREHEWWGLLFSDPAFGRRYRARGRELLRTTWSVERVHALIDALADEIRAAEARDRARWPVLRPGEWENEIVRLKDYVERRAAWMAAELLELPEFEQSRQELPFTLTISHGNESGTLYYTTDGSDPAMESLAVSPRASVYREPVPFDGPKMVRARVRVGDLWSRRADFWWAKHPPKLAFSEVMYNPPGGRDYEFVEIVNYGDEPVDLRGVRLTGEVEFPFAMGSIETLPPGAKLVVVQDLPKVVRRYDLVGMPVAGAYYGNCDNSSGTLLLVDEVGREIARASYDDGWHSSTDGKGYSLVAVRAAASLTEAGDWQRSPERYGSPGR